MHETLQKIQPDRPQLFHGIEVSYGIAPILPTFSDLSMKAHRPSWTLYLINVETIIRDRKQDTKSLEEVARAVLLDCTVMAQYIAAYNSLTLPPQSKQQPVICFYLPHYEKLPAAYLKEKLPAGTDIRWKIRDLIEKILAKDGYQESYESTKVIFDVVGKNGGWPHKDLLKDLVAMQEGLRFRKTLMVSHIPLDFHLYRVFSEFTILESYTGALKQQKQFGKKVFGDEVLPFNKYLHLLLGDKWYLKPMVPTAIKKQIKERAIKEHWTVIPDKSILESLINMKLPLPDRFIKPDI